MSRRSGLFVVMLSFLFGSPVARAAVDMSGAWAVEVRVPSLIVFSATVTQIGTSLTIVTTCAGPTCFTETSTGTIDPDTGVFSVENTAYPPGAVVTQGTVAPD